MRKIKVPATKSIADEICIILQVWQMAENIYNDEEPETPAQELESGTS